MDNKVTTKEALFMLDTDIVQDMENYADEATGLVIKHINSIPALYQLVKDSKTNAEMRRYCYGWALKHKEEFGDLFITELEVVKWNEVIKRI